MVSYAIQVHWRSWLARLHDTQEVTGSSPVWTILKDGKKQSFSHLFCMVHKVCFADFEQLCCSLGSRRNKLQNNFLRRQAPVWTILKDGKKQSFSHLFCMVHKVCFADFEQLCCSLGSRRNKYAVPGTSNATAMNNLSNFQLVFHSYSL